MRDFVLVLLHERPRTAKRSTPASHAMAFLDCMSAELVDGFEGIAAEADECRRVGIGLCAGRSGWHIADSALRGTGSDLRVAESDLQVAELFT